MTSARTRERRSGNVGDKLGAVVAGTVVVALGATSLGIVGHGLYEAHVESRTLSPEEHAEATRKATSLLVSNLDPSKNGEPLDVNELSRGLTASSTTPTGEYAFRQASTFIGVYPGMISARQETFNVAEDGKTIPGYRYTSVLFQAPDALTNQILADEKVTAQEIANAFEGGELQLTDVHAVHRETGADGKTVVLNDSSLRIDEEGRVIDAGTAKLPGEQSTFAFYDYTENLSENISNLRS